MGYPSEGLRSMVRNPLSEVRSCLEARHALSDVCTYNLCIEPGWQYDHERLGTTVVELPLWDGQAPPIAIIHQFCESAASWLSQHPGGCVAVHCKAGKGRTGALVAALLIYLLKHAPHLVPDLASKVQEGQLLPASSGSRTPAAAAAGPASSTPAAAAAAGPASGAPAAAAAGPASSTPAAAAAADLPASVLPVLQWWAARRTLDDKGLTISSQRRYVSYYASVLHKGQTDAPQRPVRVLRVLALGLCSVRQPGCAAAPCITPTTTSEVASGQKASSSATGSGGASAAARVQEQVDGDGPALGPETGAAQHSGIGHHWEWDLWDMPELTLVMWVRPPGEHTPRLVAYATTYADTRADTASSDTATPAANDTIQRLPLQVLPDGSLCMELRPPSPAPKESRPPAPTSEKLSTGQEPVPPVSQEQASSHNPTNSQPMNESPPGVLLDGDVKIQVFSGCRAPVGAAIFKGGGSLLYTWLHTAFLDDHDLHRPHSVRPGALLPTKRDEPSHQQGVGGCEMSVTVRQAELDKVQKGLRVKPDLGIKMVYVTADT